MALNPKAGALFLALLVPVRTLAQVPVTIPPDARVAVVSVQRISTESAPGKAAVGRVNALQQKRAGELRGKQTALAGLQQQLDRATGAEERAKLSAQVATERTELERMSVQAQTDLQNLQREVSFELRPKLIAALNELLKGTRIEMVTNSDTTAVWVAPGLDLTNAVIERLNATASATTPAAPSDKVAVPAAPPATSPAKPAVPAPSGAR